LSDDGCEAVAEACSAGFSEGFGDSAGFAPSPFPFFACEPGDDPAEPLLRA
jgi:hypothetical protein